MRRWLVLILCGLTLAAPGQAAMQTVQPYATNGETLGSGRTKINANFSEHEGEINALQSGKADKAGITAGGRLTLTGSGTVVDPFIIIGTEQFAVQASAPIDTSVLWVDSTNAAAPIPKVYLGGTWVAMTSTGGGSYTLPVASSTILGGVKVGSRLSIDGSGVLSADVQSGTGAVDSVNGQTGIVVLDADGISDASTTRKFTTSAEKASWDAKLGALPSWLPATGPTADNQIIQATGAGASVWTNIVDGLINDAGTGTDDLLSASEINFRIATAVALKQNVLGFTPENAANKGRANGYAGLGSDGLVPASQLPAPVTDTDDQTAVEVTVSTTNFGGNLSSADDTVQKALDTIDNMTAGGSVDLTAPGPIGSVTPSTGHFTTLIANSFDFGTPATGETGEIGLQEDPANGSNLITLKAPAALGADLVFYLPSAYAAAADYALVGNGSGTLSFAQVLLPANIGATVQGYDADLADLADGTLTGTKVDLSANTGTIYTTGSLYGRVPTINKTATATITAQECSGGLITNTGATGPIVLTLPDAAAGMRCTILLTSAYDVDINPTGTEMILLRTDVAGDAISSDATVGSYIALVGVSATEWMPIGGERGTWTDVN